MPSITAIPTHHYVERGDQLIGCRAPIKAYAKPKLLTERTSILHAESRSATAK